MHMQVIGKAVCCPRSQYLYNAVREGKWKDGIEGQIGLGEDDELVRLIVEYFYLLDYDPVITFPESDSSLHSPRHDSRDGSDTMSVRTDAGQYGHVYGTSAVSAFGGPVHGQHSPFSAVFRPRNDSSLTVHAVPTSATGFGEFPPRRRKTDRGMVTNAPEPSPLATKQPHLVLNARLYAAADKYGIDGLKALALDKFKIQLTRHWDSSELSEAIHVVYSSTPAMNKDMREAVADTLGWHGRLLDKPEIEVSIMEINGLAYELLKRSRRAEPEYME
ncbi:uncharacterized protein MYCFIDRAFT_195684 [Pseudocercospora fijiensis CIRAD86]|uniref:BTB domain-containing protein n=1 Tax=Pseudocercospora fijiensis (strain CIRAD86) TaxID=383855 RepID=M3B5S9_PSEFD|nr:uncharacterized protein MYCFIDRAFT_195684 [Pseudocercospora fijiensis CIRAD86]EME84698.1 hypothetical protein MYCFIDRAFT_195684 [Pseudocercospora fijiensis CIRAD86]